MIERRRRFCGRDFLLGMVIALISGDYSSIRGRILKRSTFTRLDEQDFNLLGSTVLCNNTTGLRFGKEIGPGSVTGINTFTKGLDVCHF